MNVILARVGKSVFVYVLVSFTPSVLTFRADRPSRVVEREKRFHFSFTAIFERALFEQALPK